MIRKSCIVICSLFLFASGLGGGTGQLKKFDKSLQEQVVESINEKRCVHDAPPLKWDSDLANAVATKSLMAKKLRTTSCHDAVDTSTPRADLVLKSGEQAGETKAAVLASHFSTNPGVVVKSSVDVWYKNKDFYDFKDPTSSKAGFAFAQLVWKSATSVGCAMCTPPAAAYTTYAVVCWFTPGVVTQKADLVANVHPAGTCGVPATSAPPTTPPNTATPETPVPDTMAPPLTIAPPTVTPSTSTPPTVAPSTAVPSVPTITPQTDVPDTEPPATPVPPTLSPPTTAPATQQPDTVSPPTRSPATAAPNTHTPWRLPPPSPVPLAPPGANTQLFDAPWAALAFQFRALWQRPVDPPYGGFDTWVRKLSRTLYSVYDNDASLSHSFAIYVKYVCPLVDGRKPVGAAAQKVCIVPAVWLSTPGSRRAELLAETEEELRELQNGEGETVFVEFAITDDDVDAQVSKMEDAIDRSSRKQPPLYDTNNLQAGKLVLDTTPFPNGASSVQTQGGPAYSRWNADSIKNFEEPQAPRDKTVWWVWLIIGCIGVAAAVGSLSLLVIKKQRGVGGSVVTVSEFYRTMPEGFMSPIPEEHYCINHKEDDLNSSVEMDSTGARNIMGFGFVQPVGRI